jgi:hypothetical protein
MSYSHLSLAERSGSDHTHRGALAFTALCLSAVLGASGASGGQLAQDTDFMAAVFDYIEKSEYDIRWIDDEAVYKSANRAQNLRFAYFNDGFAVELRDYGEGNPKPWELSIRLQAFGKTVAPGQGVANQRWTVEGNAAIVSADGITIEYSNDKPGMRQSFVITERPPGNEPLLVHLVVASEQLELAVNEAENFAYFVDAAGEEALRYWDLKVWDADQQPLDARMVKLGPALFAIVVDDEDATYPVVVDPLMWVKDWTGPSGANFGFSVSTVGRVFANDGQPAGVMVGAPYFDSGVNVDAGKVFVYYGTTVVRQK